MQQVYFALKGKKMTQLSAVRRFSSAIRMLLRAFDRSGILKAQRNAAGCTGDFLQKRTVQNTDIY